MKHIAYLGLPECKAWQQVVQPLQEKLMKTRQTLLLGLAGLGFVLAMPSYAGSMTSIESHASPAQGFVVAARDQAEPRQEQRRDFKEEERFRGNRNQPMRDTERPIERQEYGYGYERRQQPPSNRNEGRHRH